MKEGWEKLKSLPEKGKGGAVRGTREMILGWEGPCVLKFPGKEITKGGRVSIQI